MGGIGRALKKRTDTLGMTTIYHNRNRLPEELEGGAEYVSFDELLRRSDVVSLNLPLNVGCTPGGERGADGVGTYEEYYQYEGV
jgi:lactate dehydrogenase-like 2-hydroxyacid dehydrogenase